MATNEWKSRVSGSNQEAWAKSLRGGISKMTGAGAASKYRKFSVAADGADSSALAAKIHGRKRRISSLSELPANDGARHARCTHLFLKGIHDLWLLVDDSFMFIEIYDEGKPTTIKIRHLPC